jgi:Recombinase zinc beta ribbon domain
MLCVRVWSTAPGPTAPATGSERIGIVTVAPEDWSICLKDAHPAYVDWDEFMSNRRQLVNNLNRYDTSRPGIPRKGNALLQGIVSCGRCARRMSLRYSGPNGDYPVYVCVARPWRRRAAGVPGGARAGGRCGS